MQAAFAGGAPLRLGASLFAGRAGALARSSITNPLVRTPVRGRGAAVRCVANKPPTSSAPPATEASAPASAPSAGTEAPTTSGKLRLLWDSECPLCVREVNGLRARAAAIGVDDVAFVDIAATDYSPEDNGGVSYRDAMGRIHCVMPDGEVVAGVEVFRRVYEALGLGWVYAPTRLPGIGAVVEKAYDVWAVNRLRFTGRETLDEIMAAREKAKETAERGDGTCR